MKENVFKNCTSDSSIMKTMFEISSSTDSNYTRGELNIMAAERRQELKTLEDRSIINKINVPTTAKEHEISSVIGLTTSANPMNSRVFEFCENGGVFF